MTRMAEIVTTRKLTEILGVKASTITHAIKVGRLEPALINPKGTRPVIFDRDKAIKIWEETSTLDCARIERGKLGKGEAETEGGEDAEEVPDFYTSRARKEHYNAEIAKIQAETQMQELVPAEVVEKESFALARAVRESLANLADRLSNQLAGETDPQKIHALLTKEHRDCLIELCDG